MKKVSWKWLSLAPAVAVVFGAAIAWGQLLQREDGAYAPEHKGAAPFVRWSGTCLGSLFPLSSRVFVFGVAPVQRHVPLGEDCSQLAADRSVFRVGDFYDFLVNFSRHEDRFPLTRIHFFAPSGLDNMRFSAGKQDNTGQVQGPSHTGFGRLNPSKA